MFRSRLPLYLRLGALALVIALGIAGIVAAQYALGGGEEAAARAAQKTKKPAEGGEEQSKIPPEKAPFEAKPTVVGAGYESPGSPAMGDPPPSWSDGTTGGGEFSRPATGAYMPPEATLDDEGDPPAYRPPPAPLSFDPAESYSVGDGNAYSAPDYSREDDADPPASAAGAGEDRITYDGSSYGQSPSAGNAGGEPTQARDAAPYDAYQEPRTASALVDSGYQDSPGGQASPYGRDDIPGAAPAPAGDYGGAPLGEPRRTLPEANYSAIGPIEGGVSNLAAGQPALDQPGGKQLEGPQAPTITIEKTAPPEVQVGKQATFGIKVKNAGRTDAEDVIVVDEVPRGTKLLSASPQAEQGPGGSLQWRLGTLKSGEEKVISLQLLPLEEGELGSVARVAFAGQASVSTVCTRPLLEVKHTGPASVLIGENVTLDITIRNPGTGAATNVIMEEDVPEGLSHAAGKELEYEIGTLRPGETKSIELSLKAEKAGLITNRLIVRGDANIVAEDALNVEVVAPQLQVGVDGPRRRYLERQATYSVSVFNPGTAAAQEVELVAYLPKGLKFIGTDKEGQYDPRTHAVYWSLAQLPAGKAGDVQLSAMPVETGDQKLRVEGRAQLGLAAVYEQEVTVDGLAELFFEVKDLADPIEVGSETVYEIRVINQGSKTDTNVQVAAMLPPDLAPIAGEGATQGQVSGQQVVFQPLSRLAPKGTALFKIRARGGRPGDHRIRVQVTSDESGAPVAKEENTRVYSDQ